MRLISVFIATWFAAGCAGNSKTVDDPFKESKSLIVDSHVKLYQEGAFRIPAANFSIIPAGPGLLSWAGTFAGQGAGDAFSGAVVDLRESYQFLKKGTLASVDTAALVYGGMRDSAIDIRSDAWSTGNDLFQKSSGAGFSLYGRVWETTRNTTGTVYAWGGEQIQTGKENAQDNFLFGSGASLGLVTRSLEISQKISGWSNTVFTDNFHNAGEALSKYKNLSTQLGNRARDYSTRVVDSKFKAVNSSEWHRRKRWSDASLSFAGEGIGQYQDNTSASFVKAKASLAASKDVGITLPLVKYVGYCAKSIFWDGALVPLAKLTAGSLGFLGTNALAYPAMMLTRNAAEGLAIGGSMLWNATRTTGEMAYDVVTPAVGSTLLATSAPFIWMGGQAVSGFQLVGASAVGLTGAALSTVSAGAIYMGSTVLGATTQYVAAPIAGGTHGLFNSTIATGLVTGGALAALGTIAVGDTAAGLLYGTGALTSGLVAVVGTTGSAVLATGIGGYYSSKAIALPIGHVVGGGLALSAGATVHTAAQAALLTSDLIYLLVSLEGPRMVYHALAPA